MTVKQTRCPFCHSAFYITALQLNAYRGQARCGQCHQIFDATTNLVLPASTAEPLTDLTNSSVISPSNPAQPESSQTVASTPTATDSLLLDTPLSDSTISKSQPSDSPLFSDNAGLDDDSAIAQTTSTNKPSLNISASKPEPELFSDDSGLFDDDAMNDQQMATDSSKNALILDDVFNQQFLDNSFEDIDVLKQQELNDVEKLHAAADDSWINELLEDDKKPSASTQLNTATVSSTVNNTTTYVPLADNLVQRPPVDHDEDLLSFLNRTGAVSTPSTASKASATAAAPRPASHRILKPTTVAYNPAYFVGWSVMSLLMLGLLLAQYVYFNFERLAMDQRTSGYIVTLCQISGCQIPYMNENELRIKNLKLIAHNRQGETTFRGQLSNTASLSQPFPALHLTLEENGKTVASQIIQPRQYLPDNMKMLTRLATKTPYPIEFTIKTRRADIEGYTLKPQYQ